MTKRLNKNARFKYVGPTSMKMYAVLLEPQMQLIGFIEVRYSVYSTRDGSWLYGPRWHIRTKEGEELVNLPATRDQAGKWLWHAWRMK